MVDDGLALGPVPAVQLDAAAAQLQRSRVRLDGRLATQLVAEQVRVVRRVDVVVRQRLCHVLVDVQVRRVERVAQVRRQVRRERIQAQRDLVLYADRAVEPGDQLQELYEWHMAHNPNAVRM